MPVPECFGPIEDSPDRAFKGSRLPITPEFKGSLNTRYTFDMGEGEA